MQRFADTLKPFRVIMGHRQQEQGAKPSRPQPHEERGKNNNHEYATDTILKGFGLKGWKCSYEAYVNYSKVKPIAKTELINVLSWPHT